MCRSGARRAQVLTVALALVVATLALPEPAGAANPWVRVAAPSPGSGQNFLLSVECHGVACTAVGFYTNDAGFGPLLTSTSDGTTWVRRTVPRPSPFTQLYDISCVSQTHCTAVGGYIPFPGDGSFRVRPLILTTTDGGTWSRVLLLPDLGGASSQLNSIDCVTATRCRAVGSAGRRSLVLRTGNGATWFREASPSLGNGDNTLASIDCVSNGHCTAVGGYDPVASDGALTRTLVLRMNGGPPWTVVPSPNPAPSQSRAFLDEVSCVTPSTCVAVGGVEPGAAAGGRAFILRTTDGAVWTRSATPPSTGDVEIAGVECQTATACTATGLVWNAAHTRVQRNALLRTTNGTSWSSPSPESERPGRALIGVSCTSEVTCVSVGTFNATGLIEEPTRSLVMRET
jgi:photosystem II stability/assembly factor-like uncharacterized protein